MQITFTQQTPTQPALPRYRLLVLAPLDTANGETAPIPIGPGEFPAVLDALAPRIMLDVDNLLSDQGATWWLDLQLHRLADLTPVGLVRAIPELAWIDALRQAIAAVATGQAPLATLADRLDAYAEVSALREVVAACRRALLPPRSTAAPTAPAPPAATGTPPDQRAKPTAGTPANPPTSDPLDRIFELVDPPPDPANPPPATTRDQAPRPASSALSSIIAGVARTARPQPVPALGTPLAAVAALLDRQVAAIMTHPRWRAGESAWRALRDLIGCLDRSGRAEILICPTDAEQVATDLDRCLRLMEAADTPIDLVLVDLPFTAAATDRERLAALAGQAEAAAVPLLLTLSHAFFEIDGPALARLDHPARLLEAPTFIKWNAQRQDPAYRWICGCFNDCVLREPAAPTDRGETGPTPGDAAGGGTGPGTATGSTANTTLWGHAGWLVARRILEQVQQSGWPAPITGARHGRVGDLRLHDAGPPARGPRPLREALTQDQCQALAEVGILALHGAGPGDDAWLLSAPSLLAVADQADHRATAARRQDASLPVQLLRARLRRCVQHLLHNRATGSAVTALQGSLPDWIGLGDRGAQVEVRQTGAQRLLVAVTFSEQLAAGLVVELELDLQ